MGWFNSHVNGPCLDQNHGQIQAKFTTILGFYLTATAHGPMRVEVIIECNPNPSLPGFWFTLPAAEGRRGSES